MKLKEIFDSLSYGELSQVFVGTSDKGLIAEDKWPQLLNHIQLGLTTLYTRFVLKKVEHIEVLETDKTVYPLAAPDLLKILQVHTDSGVEFSLNDQADPYSLHTLTLNTILVPQALTRITLDVPRALRTMDLRVTYQAKPETLAPESVFDAELTEVELPQTHLQALLYFVASRVHNPIGMTNEFNAGNNWAAKYEMACQELENKGMRVEVDSQRDRLIRNGWV